MSRIKKVESLANPLLKEVKKIAEGRSDEFWLMEGKKLVVEALRSGISLKELLLTPEAVHTNGEIAEILSKTGGNYTEVSGAIMKKISQLETPPGILAIAKRIPVPKRIHVNKFAAFLLGIRDPGNLGTIIRSAEASGCEFVACSPDCAEPYGTKVVRGSMGSIFRIPVFKVSSETEFLEEMKRMNVGFYALQTQAGVNLFDLKPAFPALIFLGSETRGIPQAINFDEAISIPMHGQVDSLNVAMAATLCFYYFSGFHHQAYENERDSFTNTTG